MLNNVGILSVLIVRSVGLNDTVDAVDRAVQLFGWDELGKIASQHVSIWSKGP